MKSWANDTFSRAQVFRWHKGFSDCRESVQDDPHSGRPLSSRSDENMQKINDLVWNYWRLTTRLITEQLGLNPTSVHQVFVEKTEDGKGLCKIGSEKSHCSTERR